MNAQNLYLCFGVNKSRTSLIYNGTNIDKRVSCPDLNILIESNNKRLLSIKTGFFLCRYMEWDYADYSGQLVYEKKYQANFVEIPLMITLNLPLRSNNLSYFISAGPCWSHGIGGEEYTLLAKATSEEGLPDEIRSQNLGVLLCAGFNLRRLHLSMYYRTFNDMQKSISTSDIKNLDNTVIGFNIGLVINFSQNRTGY
jgi:hypothetical protein